MFIVGDTIQINELLAHSLRVKRTPAIITKITTVEDGMFKGELLLETDSPLYVFIEPCTEIFAYHCEKI